MKLSSKDIVFCVFLILKFCKGQDGDDELPYDFPDTGVEKVVCTAMDASPNDMKVDVSGAIEYEDALKLMSWNIKHSFSSPSSTIKYGAETDWKRPILDVIFDIFAKSCPGVYVPREFLNIIKELNLVYQNSVPNKIDNSAKWEKSLASLTECSGKVTGGEYSGSGRMIQKVKLQGRKGQYTVLDLNPPEELADRTPQIDLIIDAMWHAFSNAFGACYKKLNAKFNSVNNIKTLFYTDFLAPITDRWVEVGPGVDFGIIIGDYALDHILFNMRYCVTGTYMKSGVMDRMLIRPIKMHEDDTGKHYIHNTKTGRSISG